MPQDLDLNGVIIRNIPDTEDLNNPSDALKAFARQSMTTGKGSYDYPSPETTPPEQKVQTLDLAGVQIKGIPETEDLNAPSNALKAFAKQAMEQGEGEYQYSDKVPVPVDLKTAAEQSLRQQEAVTAEVAKPKTTVKGLGDAFARNVAPTAVAAAIGAPLAVAERLTNLITPAIADFINEKFNLTGTKWEQMSSQEMYDFIHDKLQLERADTPAEELAGAAGRGTAEGIGMTSLAGTLQTGAPVLGRGSFVQETGKTLADVPTREVLSSIGAEVGAEKGRQIAEEKGMGTFGQVVLPLALGAAGSGLGVGIDAFMNRRARRAIARRADLPEDVAEKVALGETRGVPVMKSDVLPPEDIGWREMQRQKLSEGLPFGTGDPRIQQYNAVKDAVYDELGDYGLDRNTIKALPAYDSPLLDDFLKVRGDKLSTNVEIKKEVIERLSGDPVPIPKTLEYLQEEATTLAGRNTEISKRLGRKVKIWEAALQGDVNGNDLSTLELIRKDLMEELQSSANEDIAKQGTTILNKAYRNIVEDMGEFIKTNGSEADFNNWKNANLELAKLSDEFGNVALEEVIEQAAKGNLNPDMLRPEAIGDMLNSVDFSERRRLYNRLSPEGQAMARTARMHTLAFNATDDFGKMVPRKFGVELSKELSEDGILLDENQRQSLVGLKELIDLTGRSDVVFKGVGGTPVSGSMWKNIATALTSGDILLSAGGMARLYETPRFRNMLVNLAELPNTRAGVMQKSEIAKRIIDLVKAFSSTEITEQETEQLVATPETSGSVRSQYTLNKERRE